MKYNLKDNGFEVLKKVFNPSYFDLINDEYILDLQNTSKIENVFMTEFGPKQIQHLEDREWFKNFANDLSNLINIGGDVLNMQIFMKYPSYKITSPHQDGAYFDNPDRKIITFWVPLHDVNVDTSCMHYLPNSHLNGLIEHKPIGNVIRTRSGKTGQSLTLDKFPLEDFIPVPMNVGDVLVHDQLCVHYSNQNKTNKKRIALTCVFEIK